MSKSTSLAGNILTNLWFDWLLVGILYAGAVFSSSIKAIVTLTFLMPIDAWKLTVIFASLSSSALIPYLWIYALPIFILAMFGGNALGKKYISNFYLKLLCNLLFLFCLTMLMDIIVLHQWSPIPDLDVGPIVTL